MTPVLNLITGIVLTITSTSNSVVTQNSKCIDESPGNCIQISSFDPSHQLVSTYDNSITDHTLDLTSPEASVSLTPVRQETASSFDIPSQPNTTPAPSSLDTIQDDQVTNGLDAQILFDLINQYRTSHDLPPFLNDENLCQIAASRTPQLKQEIMGPIPMHQGFRDLSLDFWATENLIHQPTEQAALSWWLNSPIHKLAIESQHTYSCGACQGNNCTQLFTSYTPKAK